MPLLRSISLCQIICHWSLRIIIHGKIHLWRQSKTFIIKSTPYHTWAVIKCVSTETNNDTLNTIAQRDSCYDHGLVGDLLSNATQLRTGLHDATFFRQ